MLGSKLLSEYLIANSALFFKIGAQVACRARRKRGNHVESMIAEDVD
jgi:hypothetical protein